MHIWDKGKSKVHSEVEYLINSQCPQDVDECFLRDANLLLLTYSHTYTQYALHTGMRETLV